ncbi:MAG: SH3 domain-containing protein [Verrucomicrobiota bacterium]
MKTIQGLTLALTLSLAFSLAAQTNAPAPAVPVPAVPVIPAAPEIAPPEKTESKAKPAAKKAKTPKKETATKTSATLVEITPAEAAIVKRDAANVRGKPAFIGEVITKLKKGESVTLLEEITLAKTKKDEPARWFKIAMPTNTPVWVNASFVDPTAKTVAPKKLQVRAGPGENFSVVGTLKKGDVVKEIRTVNDWIEIETPADTYAFVAADLIERTSPTAPVTPDPAPEVVAVPPDVATPTPPPVEPAAPVTPEVAPPVVTPPPVVEEPLPKRIVTREGIIRRSYNVQTPSYYELESADTKKIINYLYSPEPNFTLKSYIGIKVAVTGEESIDKRWPNTPVIEIESLEQR